MIQSYSKNRTGGGGGYLRERVHSFGYALRGIVHLLLHERNTQIHAVATVAVVTAGCLKGLSRTDWIALVFAIVLVWVAEAFNTALELVCDLYSGKTYHPVVKIIKDVASGAVLLAAIAACVVGLLVFFF
jgi:diacylglycerol kinase (ATP)